MTVSVEPREDIFVAYGAAFFEAERQVQEDEGRILHKDPEAHRRIPSAYVVSIRLDIVIILRIERRLK